jgi:hypothetical protein
MIQHKARVKRATRRKSGTKGVLITGAPTGAVRRHTISQLQRLNRRLERFVKRNPGSNKEAQGEFLLRAAKREYKNNIPDFVLDGILQHMKGAQTNE